MINSFAEKVIISRICRETSIEMYVFLLSSVSFFIWFWLARSISGRSHVVKIIRGDDSRSLENNSEKFRLFISFCHRRVIDSRLIMKLWEVTLIHKFLLLESQVRGRSIMEGKIIFSIVVG